MLAMRGKVAASWKGIMNKVQVMDPVEGRMMNVNRAGFLADVDKRILKHTYDCKPCLRLKAGLPSGGQCAVRVQILRQRDLILAAIKTHGEG